MKQLIKLNEKNLHLIPEGISVPKYERSLIRTGIVHIGIGAFHRSHQALFTDSLLHYPGSEKWGICAIELLGSNQKTVDALAEQDGLYTLMEQGPEGELSVRIVGSIKEYLYAPKEPEAVINKIADPETKIITLTITEGGYNFDEATGKFRMNEKSIQWDLNNPEKPKTVYGYLTRGLKSRKEKGSPGITIQSCDNIQTNGEVLRKMLMTYVQEAEPKLTDWIENHVTFPNSMVDRITPATRNSDIENLKTLFGIVDKCPVVSEPFIQWIIEDKFSCGRPEWEKAGVQFTDDVRPFEKMKIRLLNAGHSLLGLTGALYGYNYIHEVVRDPLFIRLLRDFMDKEAGPMLDPVPGIDIAAYKEMLIERFGNTSIKDTVNRICLQSSAKIPKFLLPTVREQINAGGPVERSAFIVAAWCRLSEGTDEAGNKYLIEDEIQEILQEKALASHSDPLAFLTVNSVFGDLINSKKFTGAYLKALQCLYHKGVKGCIREICEISNGSTGLS